MKYWGLVIVILFASTVYSQTKFDRSEKLFNKYLLTDSVKAKAQLQYQRAHIRTHKDKMRYGLNEAIYDYHGNRFDATEARLKKIEKELQPGEIEQEGELVRIRSLICFKTNRYEESSAMIERFFKKHKKIPLDLKIKLQINTCNNDIAMGNYALAHKKALVGYRVFRTKPSALSYDVKINTLTILYDVCYYEAKYDSALYYIYQQEPLLEEGSVAKSGFYDRIAITHTVLRQLEKAAEYHTKSIAILEKADVPIMLAYTLYNLGVCTKEANPDKAIHIYERVIKIGNEANYKLIVGYAMQELGDIYLTKKEYTRADKYNREALEILTKAGIPHGMMHVLLNLGRQNFETAHFNEALKYLKEAFSIAKESEDIAGLEYCYEYLYKSYELMGDYKMAHYYHKLFAQTQQKILKLDLQENIEELNLSYNVRMHKATNKLLKKEVKLKNKKISAEQKVKWLLGILLVVLLVTGWFLRRLLIQRAQLKEVELQLTRSELKGVEIEKERTVQELDIVKQQMISKNVLIGELNKLLLENEQNLVSKEQLGNLVTNDNDWVQFLAKLQLLYPQFADNLKNMHPNLSKNEFRLASLVRLDLSDKEISELLIIELASVKKAKNRLKQKLGLDASQKLDVYLGQL